MKGTIGIDEVGRGPIAGPVTVCAFYTSDEQALKKLIFGNTIRDSKKLSKTLRNNINYTIRELRKNKNSKIKLDFVIISRSASYIDKYGIVKAILSAMRAAVRTLERRNMLQDTFYKLDGGLYLPDQYKNQKTYIKGDEQHTSIAVASILAKVHRDTYMVKQSKVYSGYYWEKNAGYGTKEHYEAIKSKGVNKLHRLSFVK